MKALLKFTGYLKPYWVAAVLAPLLMALEVAMDLAQPHLLQRIVDVGIAHRDLPFVVRTGAIMLGVALVGMVGGVGCGIYATLASIGCGTDIRAAVFRKVQQFSAANLDQLETGKLLTRLTSDVDQVQEAAALFLRILVRAPLLVLGSLIMAAVTSPTLSLMLLGIGPVLILMLVLISRKAQPLFAAMQDRLDRFNAVVQENLVGVRVVKAFVRGAFETRRMADANEAFREQSVRANSLLAGIMPGMMLLVDLGVVVVVWFGGQRIHDGKMQVGQLLAFINYLVQMLSSLMMVGMLMMRVTRANASAERILEVMHTEPTVTDRPNTSGRRAITGQVTFEHVGFSYDGPESEPVLRDVSFSVAAGKTLAILGMTGSGKSTLVHLIPRLYDVTAGRVLLDGVDVRDMPQHTLRDSVRVVLQETVLFSGTIAENIRFGRPEASDAEVEEAARMAQAHGFVSKFAAGYATRIGQRGVNLSGGQRQRLAIARALVARPPVLILDDCTSAVDLATEAAILESLRRCPHVSTRILIAQRISTVKAADHILVLDGGRIAAEGTHEQLLANSEIYQGIVRSQVGEEEAANV